MASPQLRLPGTVAEIAGSPEGPKTGAFFDLDGTLIAGYSARHLSKESPKSENSASNVVKTLGVIIAGGGLTPETFEELLAMGAQAWRGRAVEDLDQLGLRLFEKTLADLIYPEMREIVRAHQRRGHTVVLTSSATTFQVEPIAAYLGIDHVLCNRFEDVDGILTGELEKPVIWGPGKSEAVQRFATDNDIDLEQSYFYADGNEDLALMYIIGNPRPTNPGSKLEKIAHKRGWPVLRFTSRGAGSALRTLVGFSSVMPIAGLGVGVGLLHRDRRAGLNFITSHWPGMLLKLNGVKLNVVGRENLFEQRPAVFIFNHRNGFDPFIASRLVERDFSGVAKAELKEDPIIGTIGKFADLAFVDRADTAASVEALKSVEDLAAKGISVLIAPEGTRLDTTEVGPFKKGAFRIAMAAKIPVVPIIIRNAELIGGRNAQTLNPGEVDVVVGAPISTKGWTLKNLEAKIAEVRQLYLDTLADWPEPDPEPDEAADA